MTSDHIKDLNLSRSFCQSPELEKIILLCEPLCQKSVKASNPNVSVVIAHL